MAFAYFKTCYYFDVAKPIAQMFILDIYYVLFLYSFINLQIK
jgi:hypothetical protein